MLPFSSKATRTIILQTDPTEQSRLSNRPTCLEWDKQLVGRINDECGVAQDGVNSSEFYKIFGKDQLSDAQDSELGVSMGNAVISGIGLADDTGLLANCPHALQNLLQLSLISARSIMFKYVQRRLNCK